MASFIVFFGCKYGAKTQCNLTSLVPASFGHQPTIPLLESNWLLAIPWIGVVLTYLGLEVSFPTTSTALHP